MNEETIVEAHADECNQASNPQPNTGQASPTQPSPEPEPSLWKQIHIPQHPDHRTMMVACELEYEISRVFAPLIDCDEQHLFRRHFASAWPSTQWSALADSVKEAFREFCYPSAVEFSDRFPIELRDHLHPTTNRFFEEKLVFDLSQTDQAITKAWKVILQSLRAKQQTMSDEWKDIGIDSTSIISKISWEPGKRGAANLRQNSNKWLRNCQKLQAGLDLKRKKSPRWLGQFFKILEFYWRYWRIDRFRCQSRGIGQTYGRPNNCPLAANTIEKTTRCLNAILNVVAREQTSEGSNRTQEYIKATDALLHCAKKTDA